jgi:hypothetical protein
MKFSEALGLAGLEGNRNAIRGAILGNVHTDLNGFGMAELNGAGPSVNQRGLP